MSSRVLSLLVMVTLSLGLLPRHQGWAHGLTALGAQPPLRSSEPLDVVVADLEAWIPTYLREQGVPGAALALVRNGEVVWTAGFGLANVLTGQRITADTLFEVASNSKVVTAYTALRLVDQGLLSLDEPLNTYLPDPWLPDSPYREEVTLRRVLSHTSGLGHNTLGRELRFVPGSGYSYSAVGFLYLQAVIEHVTGEPLEEVARALVFEPLGMSSSSFVNEPALLPRTANGHLRTAVPLLLFLVPFGLILLLVGLVGLLIRRLRTGRWRPTVCTVLGAAALALVLTCLLVLGPLGASGMLGFATLTVLSGLASALALGLAFVAGRAALARLLPGRRALRRTLTILWTALVAAGLALLVHSIDSLPVPKGLPVQASAAGTVRTTARDLAVFLVELGDPQHLSADLAAQLRTPQVRLSHDLSWGLGPGIQHSQQGDALWQWGQAPDFQSVMLLYPDQGTGVVALTNSDLLNPDVAIAIAHRALGGKIEPLRLATHLAFNYDGPLLGEQE